MTSIETRQVKTRLRIAYQIYKNIMAFAKNNMDLYHNETAVS
jgi:hypothetical protein